MRDLRLEYLDSYLIHFPIALAYVAPETRYPPGWFFEPDARNPSMQSIKVPLAETWGAMEELVDAGLVRTIGVSNFGVSLLRDLQAGARIQPSSLQVEMHPRLTQKKLLRFCDQEDIAVTAFSPLGAPSYVSLGMAKEGDSLFMHESIRAIADAVGRTPAQVLLRWGVQRGTAVVPKTSQPKRLAENISLFDFSLSFAIHTKINFHHQLRNKEFPLSQTYSSHQSKVLSYLRKDEYQNILVSLHNFVF